MPGLLGNMTEFDCLLSSRHSIPISPLSTDDLPFLTDFQEKMEIGEESNMIGAPQQPSTAMLPPISRSHPRWGDRLTLVACSQSTMGQGRTIRGEAQLYPCARLETPNHAEIILRIEPGTRDCGLETELMRRLMELAGNIGVKTVDVFVPYDSGELADLCRCYGSVPEEAKQLHGAPSIYRLHVPEAKENNEFFCFLLPDTKEREI